MEKTTDALFRFFRSAYVAYRALYGYLGYETYILLRIVQPVIQLSFFVTLARYVYQASDVSPWIIGNSLLLTSMNSIFGVGAQMTGERNGGTLKLIIASPMSTTSILLPRFFFHYIDSIISVSVGIIAGWVLFDFSLTFIQLIQLYIVISVAAFSSMGLGMLINSISLLTRDINLMLNLAATILLVFTGANIPMSKLPPSFRVISDILPLTRSIIAGRHIYNGSGLNSNLSLLFAEFLVGISYFMAGFVFFNIIERIARKNATLDVL
jgi:ABC-2 type transport system permease protein